MSKKNPIIRIALIAVNRKAAYKNINCGSVITKPIIFKSKLFFVFAK